MRIASILLLAFMSPAAARAEQYWIAYEGNDFPENEGWIRTYGDGTFPPSDQPDRSIENGELVVSTERDPSLWEYYSRILRDPENEEIFVAEWRLRAFLFSGSHDNTVVIARSGSPGHVSFRLEADALYIPTDDIHIELDPTTSHVFRFQSNNMQSYALFVDGVLTHSGSFESNTLLQEFVAWGPGVQGASSISSWDYFRYGVVPEPSASIASVSGFMFCISKRGRAMA